MNNYKVGQVVYLLNQKTLSILPALIVEEIIRKTVDDTFTEYMIQLPDKKSTRVKLSKVSSMIFSDISDLRTHMLENTRKNIESMLSNAVNLKEEVFAGNYVDIGQSINKAEDVMDVFLKDKKDDIAVVEEPKKMMKIDQFKPKVKSEIKKNVQKDVKDVIMNGKINTNTKNIQQQEKQ